MIPLFLSFPPSNDVVEWTTGQKWITDVIEIKGDSNEEKKNS